MARSLLQRLDLPDWIHSEHSIHDVTALAIGAPVKGQSVTLDGVKYVVRSVSIEYGVIRIVLADEEQ